MVMQCYKHIKRYIFKTSVLKNAANSVGIPKTRSDVQVVVIGGGLAGLSAASHLIKNGFNRTIVLEATERTGGRVNSKHFGDAFCELGAKWIAIDASRGTMYELLQQTTSLQKRIQQQNEMLYVNTMGDRINKKLPDVISALFRRLCSTIEIEEKYKAGNLYDLNSVHTYFQAESKKFVKFMFNKDPEREIASDIFHSLFKEFGSLFGCCLEYVNIDQISKMHSCHCSPIYIPTGMDSLLTEITKNIDGSHMQVGKPVGEIKWNVPTQAEQKQVGCLDGSAFIADHIICTLPLGVLKNFSNYIFKPMLPQEKQLAIRNLGFGSPVKIYFEYAKNIKPWFATNIRPLFTVKERKKDLKWTKQVVEISKLPASNRVLEVLIGGYYYIEIEKLPDTEVSDEITKLLRTCLKNPKIPYPESILRSNWSSSACYLGGKPYFSVSSSINDVAALAAPLGSTSLLFAGDATILNGFGTVDGARISGIREAQRIIEHYEALMT